MSGVFSSAFPGYLLQVSPSALAKCDTARVFPVNPGPAARITKFQFAVADAHFGAGLQNSFSFVLNNSEKLDLPAGEANLYKSGEYVGRFRFEGISSGRSRVFSRGM